MKKEILLAHNFIEIPTFQTAQKQSDMLSITLATNFIHYGYVLSADALNTLQFLSQEQLTEFWQQYEPVLKKATGADRKMENHVVYKNFPEEVLNKTEAEYWFAQIFMYLGVDKAYFAQHEKTRSVLSENTALKVLSVAQEDTIGKIYSQYVASKNRWSDNQKEYFAFLNTEVAQSVALNDFGFKENGLLAVVEAFKAQKPFDIKDATDVLRLAILVSGFTLQDNNIRFARFSKSQKRILLKLLDNSNNLMADMALNKNLWKKFMKNLHPGDFKFENVKKAYHELYNNNIHSFNSVLETSILSILKKTAVNDQEKTIEKIGTGKFILSEIQKQLEPVKKSKKIIDRTFVTHQDEALLNTISQRPGEFVRRFHFMYEIFGAKAVESFVKIMPKLNNLQLVKFKKYILTINTRKTLVYAPKGNWSKMKIHANEKIKLAEKDIKKLVKAIDIILANRIKEKLGKGIKLDEKTTQIKLQTNDSELAVYGRGTEFDIPKNVTFLRSASFWQDTSDNTVWFDNGWNFFDADWKGVSTCSWSSTHDTKGAAFSGDPVNSRDLEGKACQMIDLCLEKLKNSGIRYAVWNILAYSHVSFSQAEDVLATLQMGEVAFEGNLYEPSRAQMVFPLKGNNLTKYIAYIDLEKRKIVYMDANLKGNVQGAENNIKRLEDSMPAYVEYLESLPSVYDLFEKVRKGAMPILYSDKDMLIKTHDAYVFKKENTQNKFNDISINKILE